MYTLNALMTQSLKYHNLISMWRYRAILITSIYIGSPAAHSSLKIEIAGTLSVDNDNDLNRMGSKCLMGGGCPRNR